MKFQTQAKQDNYFLSQPHQPFFLFGVVTSLVMMLLFGLSYKGVIWLNMWSVNFHAYSLIFIVFSNFFTGFLFTTFPKFCQCQVIPKQFYTKIFYANIVGTLLFIGGSFWNHSLLILGMTLLFVSQIFVVLKLQHIYRTGAMPQKQDPFWILTANYFGLLGHLLFIVIELTRHVEIQTQLFGSAVSLSFYMYLVFLGLSVAQRMVPFFSHAHAPKNEQFMKIVFALFLLKSVASALEIKAVEILVDILLGIYLLQEFRRWKLSPFHAPAILWVLHLALLWLPLGLFLSALSVSGELFFGMDFYFFNNHLLSIGFLTTILIGFGTRVTLGHSGQSPHADRVTTNLFWLIQIVVLMRALYSMSVAFGLEWSFLFDISLSLWLILFLVWSGRYAKVLIFGVKR